MPPTPLHEQILRMRFGKGEPPGSLLCDVIQAVAAFFTHDGLRASRAVRAGL